MSWMAAIPTRDTTIPWHWVTPGATWHGPQYQPLRNPGYDTVCRTARVVPVIGDDADYGPVRPYCPDCTRQLAATPAGHPPREAHPE